MSLSEFRQKPRKRVLVILFLKHFIFGQLSTKLNSLAKCDMGIQREKTQKRASLQGYVSFFSGLNPFTPKSDLMYVDFTLSNARRF